jgi:hypothetical protein
MFSEETTMALVSKPVRIGQAIYLRVPKDAEELMDVMATRVCTVDFQIDEKGCSLVYSFSKAPDDMLEGPPQRPLWMMEKAILA